MTVLKNRMNNDHNMPRVMEIPVDITISLPENNDITNIN